MTVNSKQRLWAFCLILISLYATVQMCQGFKIEASLLTLLPHLEKDPQVDKALTRFHQQQQNKVVFLLSAEKNTPQVLQQLAKLCQSSGLFNIIQYQAPQKSNSYYAIFSPMRWHLLTIPFRQKLLAKEYQAITEQSLNRLYSPFAAIYSMQLQRDPFFHFFDYLTELNQASQQISIKNGYLMLESEKKAFYILVANLIHSPFNQQNQQKFKQLNQQINALKKQNTKVQWLNSGVIYHAIAGFDSAQYEISTIGLGSLVGIMLLMLLSFRAFLPLVASSFSILIGIVVGFSSCLWWFQEIHLLTLVFGASLIGISIDYSFHYFVEAYYTKQNPVLKPIFSAILLGFITSLMAYSALAFTELPLLQQMAVFSCSGLTSAFLTVILFYPKLKIPLQKRQIKQFQRLHSFILFWKNIKQTKGVVIGFSLVLIGLIATLSQLTTDNNIRHFQSLNPALVVQENKIKKLMGIASGFKYLVIKAPSQEALLQKEEVVRTILDEWVKNQQLNPYLAISKLLPSIQRQRQNQQLLTELYQQENTAVKAYFQQLGLSFNEYKIPKNSPFLTLEELKKYPIYNAYQLLLQKIDTDYLSILVLSGSLPDSALKTLAEKAQIHFVNDIKTIQDTLDFYQKRALQLVAFAYLLIALLLFSRYSIKKAIWTLLPPFMATLMALAWMAIMGITLNLFNTLALILVLGIGIDYSLFFAENSQSNSTTFFAIFLSAITTILSFGLLALSATPVIASFGLMVLIGILMAFLFSPLAKE